MSFDPKEHSLDMYQLDFGMMILVPQGIGLPPAKRDTIETVVLVSEDGRALTKFGRILDQERGDYYKPISGFTKDDPPLEQVFLPEEGEKAFWQYATPKKIVVPCTGERFRVGVPLETSGIYLGTGVLIKYCHSDIINNGHVLVVFHTYEVLDQPHKGLVFFVAADDELERSFTRA